MFFNFVDVLILQSLFFPAINWQAWLLILKTYNHKRPEFLPKREAKVRKSKGENQSFFTDFGIEYRTKLIRIYYLYKKKILISNLCRYDLLISRLTFSR